MPVVMNQHKANTGDDHIFSQRPMIYGPHVVTLVLIQHSYTFSNCDFNNFRKKIEISRDNCQNVYVNEFSLLDAFFRSKQFPTNDRLMNVYASGQLELQ